MTRLARAIRAARRRRGWSQTELAFQLRLASDGAIQPTQALVSLWEHGLKPSKESLYWLKVVLPELDEGDEGVDKSER